MSRPSFTDLGIVTARLWAQRSSDPKVQVGACLMDRHNRVVAVGYNGRAAGEPNERESLEQGLSGYVHAEINALTSVSWEGDNYSLFLTHEPCATCARVIINTRRISQVYYEEDYVEAARSEGNLPPGNEILRAAGISTWKIQRHGV